MNKYFIIHEGECEESVISYLKFEGYIKGRPIKRVLSTEKNINRTLNMLHGKSHVLVVLDTDTYSYQDFDKDRLTKNLSFIKNKVKTLRIITQDCNLEDELVRSMNLRSKKELYKLFNADTAKKYKSKLSKIETEKLKRLFKSIDLKVLWSRKTLKNYIQDEEIINQNCSLHSISKKRS